MCVCVCVGVVLNALERFFELMERFGSQISCKPAEAYRRSRQSDVSLTAPGSARKLSECDFDNANVNVTKPRRAVGACSFFLWGRICSSFSIKPLHFIITVLTPGVKSIKCSL